MMHEVHHGASWRTDVSSAKETRKVFVSCDQAATLTPRHVDETVAAFLREKVLPVVGEHCRINLHWNGVQLSSLHIRSVFPDQCELVPKDLHIHNAPAHNSDAALACREDIKFVAFSPDDIKDEVADIKSDFILDEIDTKKEPDPALELNNTPEKLDAPQDRIISARMTFSSASAPSVRTKAKLPLLRPKPCPNPPPQPLMTPVAPIPVLSYGQAPFMSTIFAAPTTLPGNNIPITSLPSHIRPSQIIHLSPPMSASTFNPYSPTQLERNALTGATGVASTATNSDTAQSDQSIPNGQRFEDVSAEDITMKGVADVTREKLEPAAQVPPKRKQGYTEEKVVGARIGRTVRKKKFVSKAAYMRDYRRRCKSKNE